MSEQDRNQNKNQNRTRTKLKATRARIRALLLPNGSNLNFTHTQTHRPLTYADDVTAIMCPRQPCKTAVMLMEFLILTADFVDFEFISCEHVKIKDFNIENEQELIISNVDTHSHSHLIV